MLTFKLWRALNRPRMRSPLYRRIFSRQGTSGNIDFSRIPLFGLFRNAGLVVLPILLIMIGVPLMIPLYYLLMLVAPILLPIANTIYGTTIAINVSGSIVREREHRTYDVLCTAPEGTLGMHWAYCTGWIHFHYIYRRIMVGVLSIGIVASLLGLPAQVIFGAGQESAAVALVRGLALGTIFVVDYAQTFILSSLLSLLIPTRVENEADARIWAGSTFVALQVAVYLPTLLLTTYALPNTLHLVGIDPQIASLLIPLLMVGFFLALRELIISALWHAVEQQLTTTAVELDAVTGLAV